MSTNNNVMSRITIKIDRDAHQGAIVVCDKSGRDLIDYLSEAVQEKNEREMPEIIKKLQERQENREAFAAYCLSILKYNADRAIKDKQEYMSLVESVFK